MSALDKETEAARGANEDESVHGTMDSNGLEKSDSRDTKKRSSGNSDSDSGSTFSYLEDGEGLEPTSRNILSRTISEVRDGIESRRDLDLELGSPVEEKKSTTTENPTDPNLVTWDGPDDPENPKNWQLSRKYGAVVIVSFFTLVSPVSSSMVAPSLTTIGKELDITESCKSRCHPLSMR